jgi:hypothetical protein
MRRSSSPDVLKQLVLLISLLGLTLLLIGISARLALYIGVTFELVSYVLTLAQAHRLKQGKLFIDIIIWSMFLFPILLIGIFYGMFGTTEQRDDWEWSS